MKLSHDNMGPARRSRLTNAGSGWSWRGWLGMVALLTVLSVCASGEDGNENKGELWRSVSRVRGRVSIEYRSGRNDQDSYSHFTADETTQVQVDFMMERERPHEEELPPGLSPQLAKVVREQKANVPKDESSGPDISWHAVSAKITGVTMGTTDHAWPHFQARSTTNAEFSGLPLFLEEFHLGLNIETGVWQLASPGRLREKYRIVTVGTELNTSLNESREINEVGEIDGVENAVFDGKLSGKPVSVKGTSKVEQGGTRDNLTGWSSKIGRLEFWPEFADVEVEVTIEGYEKWLPKGSIPTPAQPGNHLVAHATLKSKTGKVEEIPEVKHFKFELVEVSREPGVCMNWPLLGADGDNPPEKDPAPDLRFAAENGAILTKEALTAQMQPTKNSAGHDSASVRVNSYDFGGNAELRVTCVLADEREIIGTLKLDGIELVSIPLPYRRTGSLIAKAWQDLHKLTGGDGDDLDDEPVGDGNRGDGFSNYEEYRGFVENRIHIRTKPDRKDLFLQNRIGKRALDGIYKLVDLTHLAVHYEMRPDEMPNSRRMNVNRSANSPRTSQENQHGLILHQFGSMTFSLADIEGDTYRPKYTDIVVILDTLLVFATAKDERGQQELELAVTIAHEILHAIGVRHHGEVDPGTVSWFRNENVVNNVVESMFVEQGVEWRDGGYVADGTPGKMIHIFGKDGAEVTPENHPDYLSAMPTYCYVGTHSGQHSGVVDCVMRYDCANAYKIPLRDNDRFLFALPRETTGQGLCTSAVGTGCNAAGLPATKNRYGNATLGDCAKQICVRDDGPDRNAKPKPKVAP